MSATLVFGSAEANAVLKQNRLFEAQAKEEEKLGPIRRWRVDVEVVTNECRFVEARTEKEAMATCRAQYPGEPYDAVLAKRQ